MARRSQPFSGNKDESRKVIFFEGFDFDIALGPGSKLPNGQIVYVRSVGLVEKHVMADLYPQVKTLNSEDLTMVAYSEEKHNG